MFLSWLGRFATGPGQLEARDKEGKPEEKDIEQGHKDNQQNERNNRNDGNGQHTDLPIITVLYLGAGKVLVKGPRENREDQVRQGQALRGSDGFADHVRHDECRVLVEFAQPRGRNVYGQPNPNGPGGRIRVKKTCQLERS